MAADVITEFGKSIIQHGKLSDRIYLMKLHPDDVPDIIPKMEELAEKENYSKIFCKVPADHQDAFQKAGYCQEAMIPKFFKGEMDCCFLSRFYHGRDQADDPEQIKQIVKLAQEKGQKISSGRERDYTIRQAEAADAECLCPVFAEVFESYPFPIFDPEYIRKTMRTHVDYYLACREEDILAVSSAEMDHDMQNVEMTDFATPPAHRGQGTALALLQRMEEDMAEKGMKVFYTIARAASPGMNITFAKNGYTFGGTLINNTNIAGRIESMNIWYKLATSI